MGLVKAETELLAKCLVLRALYAGLVFEVENGSDWWALFAGGFSFQNIGRLDRTQ